MSERLCDAWGLTPQPWRFRSDPPWIGADNMAVDEASLEEQRSPSATPILRVFRWATPTLSFGRLQDSHDAANKTMLQGCRAMVRRPTGGGMVAHKDDLSLSLAWRRDHPSFPACVKYVYRAVHETVREALLMKGIETEFFAGPAAGGMFCFPSPSADDLMRGGAKVLGGALRVTSWGRLYQGDLLTGALGLEKDEAESLVVKAFELKFFKSAPERVPSTPPAT